jgi:hypothetical protein
MLLNMLELCLRRDVSRQARPDRQSATAPLPMTAWLLLARWATLDGITIRVHRITGGTDKSGTTWRSNDCPLGRSESQ